MAIKILDLTKNQPGFLGIESAREDIGITISYWKDEESIKNWKFNSNHIDVQKKGQEIWYKNYKIRVTKVERDYEF